MKRILFMLAVLGMLCASACAAALTVNVPASGQTVQIVPAELEGENWLFLPAFADLEALFPDAEETDEEGVWYSPSADVSIMVSKHLRALFLSSDDPVNEGRAYIENCERHVNRTTGSILIVAEDGTVDCEDDLRQIRGRGNSTWNNAKKPYQIKLENRLDLLKTGEKAERNRTWVLLADAWDSTLLHNRIAMDLALDLGLEGTPHSEHVDLYYDGEYRGTYLLCEKVEIGEGRIDEMDYNRLIEEWNRRAGQQDLDALPVGQATNRYGGTISFVQNLAETEDPGAGAYLLEMEGGTTLSDRSWFTMSDGSIIGCKNPENASETMMRYISEKLEEARQTLQHGGVHPQTGVRAEEVFDLDAFARAALLYELSYSDSGYHYSSSFFVLPAGESRFEPGAVWDFDLAWRYFRNGMNDRGIGLKDRTGWLAEFYSVPAFAQAMQRIYEQELYPLLTDVLLGGESGRCLRPLDAYVEEIGASQRMNERLWGQKQYLRGLYASTFDGEIEWLRQFVTQRMEWLQTALSTVDEGGAVNMTLYALYGRVEEGLDYHVMPWSHAVVQSCSHEQIAEATEEDYALWQAEVVLAPEEGQTLSSENVILNGTVLQGKWQEDGTLKVAFTFEDPTYRPVDYYGEDIGLVYNFDVYCRNYPDIAEACDYDPQTMMDYFCDEGMYEGHAANDFFDPNWIRLCNPQLEDLFGEDWQLYYWDFIYYGFDEGWLNATGEGFRPVVRGVDE